MNREINELARALKVYKQACKQRKAADKILTYGAATVTLTPLDSSLPPTTLTFCRDGYEMVGAKEIADEVVNLAFGQEIEALNRVAYWAREVALTHDQAQQEIARVSEPLR